jgi:hypothetical protein
LIWDAGTLRKGVVPMKRPQRETLIVGLSVAMLMCAAIATHPSIALGWSHNEHQINNTGATAYDVYKILEGDYTITDMMEWDFPEHEYYHRTVDDKIQTVLRWWGGAVPNGEAGDVCFTAVPLGGSASQAKIIAAGWTDADGVPLGDYYPALGAEIDFGNLGNPVVKIGNQQAAQIVVDAGNPRFWEEGDFILSGIAASLHVVHVWAAIVDGALGPQDLFVEKTIFDTGPGGLADSFFDVFTELSIDGGMIVSMPLGEPIQLGQSVVLVADLGGGNYDLYNFQAVPEPCTMLLCGLGSLCVLLRRRTA